MKMFLGMVFCLISWMIAIKVYEPTKVSRSIALFWLGVLYLYVAMCS